MKKFLYGAALAIILAPTIVFAQEAFNSYTNTTLTSGDELAFYRSGTGMRNVLAQSLGAIGATELTLANTGLHLLDTNASHDLILAPGSNITADRTLTITTGDADRTLTLSGDATISGTNTGDQTTISGNAGTATALAANGSNCSAGQFPLGVDASGASESCTSLPTSIAGTANQITASAATGSITLSTPQDIGTGSSPQFAGVNVGNSDTTITRSGAGDIAVEGNAVYRAGGTDVPVADGGTGASSASGARTNLGFRANEYCYAISDYNTTAITAATGLATEYLPAAFTVTGVRAYTRIAPTGLMTIDINEAGTTILSTKLTIDANEKTSGTAAAAAVISDSAIAANAEITIDVDSTTGGKGGVVCLEGTF